MSLEAETTPAATWISPVAVLPAQFHPTPRLGGEGERRLILALIEEAVHTWQKNAFADSPRGRREFQEADQWLGGKGEPMIRFEDACAMLGIEAEWLRTRLRRWRTHRAENPGSGRQRKVYRSRARTIRMVGRPAVNE